MLDLGLSQQQFYQDYLEKQPYLRKAAMAAQPMQWRDVDAVLQALEADPAALQLFNNGLIPPPSYLDQGFELGRSRTRINKARFYGLLQAGATAVLNRIEDQSVAAQRLCHEIRQFVGHTTTSNAYVSFGGQGTFGKHWDTHDVFAVQLLGRKRWLVFPPTQPLPMPHQTSEVMQQRCPETPVMDCVLTAGDVLYIPRGWWHQVIPFDAGSLHLSIGTYLPTLNDYLLWVCRRVLPEQLDARAGVNQELDASSLAKALHTLGQQAQSPAQFAAFVQEWHGRERRNAEFDLSLFLEKGQTLQDDDQLVMTACHSIDSARGEAVVNGGRLKLEPLSRAMLAVITAGPISLKQLQEKLPNIPKAHLQAAVLDLVRYEVLSIARQAAN